MLPCYGLMCFHMGVMDMSVLLERIREVGLAVDTVDPVTGGVVALAGMAVLNDGSRVFAKTVKIADSDIFEVEAEGLRSLRDQGGVNTPGVLHVTSQLLILEPLRHIPAGAQFWEQLGRIVANLHATTVSDYFGWHRDGWLGRLRQDNTRDADGYSFFAQRRILRWLSEPLVEETFGSADRRAIERLCERLPELVPDAPPAMTHGDLWSGNIMATPDGVPTLIDTAVSFSWPEADLSMLYCSPRPPESDRFFDAYHATVGLREGWAERMPIYHLRELLSVIAHDDDDWGAAAAVRKVIAPFRRSA